MGQAQWRGTLDFVKRPGEILIEVAEGRNLIDAWGEMRGFIGAALPAVGQVMMVAEMVTRPPSEWTLADTYKPVAMIQLMATGDFNFRNVVSVLGKTPGGVAQEYMSYLILVPVKLPELPPEVNLFHMVCQFMRMKIDDDGYEFKLQLAPGGNPIGRCLSFNPRTGLFDVIPLEPVITSWTVFSYGPDKRLVLAGQALTPRSRNGSTGYYLRPNDAMAPVWLMLSNGTIVMETSRRHALAPAGLLPNAAISPELIPLYEE